MLLVEFPALLYRNPVEIHVVENVIKGLDSSLEIRSIGLLKGKAFCLKELTGLFGLILALRSQIDVCPAGETVFEVPGAFAVSNEYYSFHYLKDL